jgi:serine/threonine protein kinase
MRLEPEQLVRLARLTDEWLDLSEVARAAWLAATLRHQPDLAPALLAMTAEAGPGKTAGNDPLSLPSMDGAAAADPSEHREGDLVGPYRLMSLLGIGGMGAVWLADQVDGRVQRKVAVKLLGPERAQAGWRLRFERERDILAAMEHPGIARLIDAGSASDGQPYLAMAYVKGQSIVSYAQQHKLDIAARVKLAIELLAIVQYAHASLVIHRDLKPGNILVDEDGRVALLDFGIAKLLASSDLTPASGDVTALAGNSLTLDYASPEQVSGRAMGVGTDIYSAGVVLYELLAGQRPYRLRRGTRAAMEEAILEQEVMPPSQRVDETYAKAMGLNPRKLSRQLHGDLDAILLKALARESALRYSTAEAFADDLRRWMDGRPVRAQGLSRWYVARRVLSRYRWPVAGAALVLASLSVGLGVALWQAGLAREEASAAKATESWFVGFL